MRPVQSELRRDLFQLIRATAVFAASAVAAGAVFYTLLLEIRKHRNIVESGIVETAQLAILGVACAAYAVQAVRDREKGRALAMVALAVLAMFVREMDGWFDVLTGDHSFWSYVETPVVLAFVAIPVRRFSRTVDHLARFVSTPQCLLFVAGVAFAVVVAQLVGYKEIWNRIFDVDIWNDACAARLLDDGRLPHDLDVSRHVKNTVEESIELASYLLILGSAVIPPLLRSGAPESRRA